VLCVNRKFHISLLLFNYTYSIASLSDLSTGFSTFFEIILGGFWGIGRADFREIIPTLVRPERTLRLLQQSFLLLACRIFWPP